VPDEEEGPRGVPLDEIHHEAIFVPSETGSTARSVAVASTTKSTVSKAAIWSVVSALS
jgi:hypothetical protein